MGKSPFNGKTYNEVLTLNREANIKLDSIEYLRMPMDGNFIQYSQLIIFSLWFIKKNVGKRP